MCGALFELAKNTCFVKLDPTSKSEVFLFLFPNKSSHVLMLAQGLTNQPSMVVELHMSMPFGSSTDLWWHILEIISILFIL